MSQPAIELAKNVYRVPTMGSSINSFFFIEDDGSITIVDTGLKSAPKKIIAAIRYLNHDLKDVRKILFTHSHDDHTDGAAKLISQLDSPKVSVHEDEVKYMETGENPPRDLSHFAGIFFKFLPTGSHDPVKIDSAFKNHELLPIAGGLEVIHTPGHTPGHASFLHKPSGVLITGDSVVNFANRMTWSLSAFCTNFNQSKETALKFLDLEFETAAFTHGPHIQTNAKYSLSKFLSNKVKV